MAVSVLNSWKDLRSFGINALTREACAVNMRMLCDLTHEGQRRLESFFGGNVSFRQGSNWNSGGTASILLPVSIFGELAAFILLENKENDWVLISENGSVMGVTDAEYAGITDFKWIAQQYRNVGKSRNTHAITGRTE